MFHTPPPAPRTTTHAERHGASIVARRLLSINGVDATPTDVTNQGSSPHYCPICMLHFPIILSTKCCQQNICGTCAMDLVTRAAGQPIAERMLRAPSLVPQRKQHQMSKGETLALILSQTPAKGAGVRPNEGTGVYQQQHQQGEAFLLPPIAQSSNPRHQQQQHLRSMYAAASGQQPVVPCPYCSRTMKVRFVTAHEASKSYKDSPIVPTVRLEDRMMQTPPHPPPTAPLISSLAARAVRSAGIRLTPRRLELNNATTTPIRPTHSPNTEEDNQPTMSSIGGGVYAAIIQQQHHMTDRNGHDGRAGAFSSLRLSRSRLANAQANTTTTNEQEQHLPLLPAGSFNIPQPPPLPDAAPSVEAQAPPPAGSNLPPIQADTAESAAAPGKGSNLEPCPPYQESSALVPTPPAPRHETFATTVGSTFQELRRQMILWNGASAAYSTQQQRHSALQSQYDAMMSNQKGCYVHIAQEGTGKLPTLDRAGGGGAQRPQHQRRNRQRNATNHNGSGTAASSNGRGPSEERKAATGTEAEAAAGASGSSWCPIM